MKTQFQTKFLVVCLANLSRVGLDALTSVSYGLVWLNETFTFVDKRP